jgi:bifunctional non-homologous end joining protein LigD
MLFDRWLKLVACKVWFDHVVHHETVIDGDVVALDESGRPSFSALQNEGALIVYFVFDVLVLGGRSVMADTLGARREFLTREVLPKLADPIREAPRFDASLADLVRAVREQGLERLVAKRLDASTSTAPAQERGARCGSTGPRSSSSAGTRRAGGRSTR